MMWGPIVEAVRHKRYPPPIFCGEISGGTLQVIPVKKYLLLQGWQRAEHYEHMSEQRPSPAHERRAKARLARDRAPEFSLSDITVHDRIFIVIHIRSGKIFTQNFHHHYPRCRI